MTVKFATNDKIAETSSKGNQEKWRDNGRWYKLDQFGYEALAETVISRLLERSSIEAETPFRFVRYRMERMSVHGRDRNGCSSSDFLRPGPAETRARARPAHQRPRAGRLSVPRGVVPSF